MSGSIRCLLALLLIATASLAQSRPESSATRPARALSVKRLPFPIKGVASVPSGCSFSPDGRWLALAEGYDRKLLNILDFAKREVVFSDDCPDPHEIGVRRANPASWPPSFGWKSDRLAYVRDQDVVLLELDHGRWQQRKVIPLPFKPGIFYPCPRTISWSSDDSELMLPEAGQGVYRAAWNSGVVRKVDCGAGDVYSGMFLGKLFSVISCEFEGRFDTRLFADDVVDTTWNGIALLARSGDRGTWLVRRQAKEEPTFGVHVEVWDALTQKPRTRLDGAVNLAAFSADGRILVTSESHVVVVHDGQTGTILHTIDHYAGDRVVALAISPDGRHLLTMGRPTNRDDAGIVLWELAFE